jgi:two-component system, cell cycle sensor histidine kinase and response regulator CckA
VSVIDRWAKKLREHVPDTVLAYGGTVLAVALLAGPAYLYYSTPSPRPVVFGAMITFSVLLVILASAWFRYGAGLLACALIFLVVPRLLFSTPRTNFPLQFVILSAISVLVSRVADVGRRHGADLRRSAAELEKRVRERTAEAVAAANAVREQAQLLELARDAILSLDSDGTIRHWNAGAERMYGWTRADAVGKVAHELLLTRFPEPIEEVRRKLSAAGHWEGELQHTCRDGSVVRVLSRWALRRDAEGKPAGYLEINTDVTERRKIEEQLRHTQKLESLGVLAGGVAHDFNNLLTGILGNASLALDAVKTHDPNRRPLEEVVRAAERAADLTRQLLAYAGKGQFVLRPLDLSALVREISGLVQTSIAKSVQLRLQLAPDLPVVEADPGQLQQIVMNLVINGAEAIGEAGGTVLVRTGAQTVDAQYIGTVSTEADQLRPGPYVMLEVHDTGCGMPPETLSRIFDPFFTTKFTGRGLGLSAVQGIVRAHHGALKVYSTPGQGTTFKVLLPASNAPHVDAVAPFAGDLAGAGTILIVDDEEIVRHAASNTLARYGYDAIVAADGAEALRAFRRDPGRIALVLLDLTMPVMSGEQTLRELQTIRPDVRVLLTSGYNEVEAVQRFVGKGLAGFIQKPYTSLALAEKVKEALAG